MLKRTFITAVVYLFSFKPLFSDNGGLKISAAVDITGNYKTSGEGKVATDRTSPRTIDLMVYGAIDPFFDGTMSMAAHEEDGESVFEVHEAYISSDRLVPSSRFRLGQFFLDIGRLSRFHQHEWPFISTPLIHEELFGEEGVLDSGLEYSFLFPLPVYLDLTIGVSNGYTFGHSHEEGDKPRHPNYYAHLVSFMELGELNLQPGVSALWRTTHDNRKEQYLGIELTGKVKSNKIIKWLTQTELWSRTLTPENSESDETIGGYSFLQYGFESGLALGVRGDFITNTTLKDADGNKIDNHKNMISTQLGYKPSEFSNFRLAYNLNEEKNPGEEAKQFETLDIQATFILGAHPAHAF